jgi:hypothetical protein
MSHVAIVLALAPAASGAAFAASNAGLPAEQHQNGVAYLTGGVGEDEAKAFEQAAPRFPLALEFADRAGKRNEFIADVDVKVIDGHGKTVLSTKTDGPFLLARVPSGRYSVAATYEGKTLKRTVRVHDNSTHPLLMEWKGAKS